MLKILKQSSIIKQIILYGFIGALSSGLDLLIFTLFANIGINIYISNFISINVGIICSFFLNSYFNFKLTDRMLTRGLKFFMVGYCGLALSMLIVYLGGNVFHIGEFITKVISIFIVAAFQFVLNKLITFKGDK